MRKVKEQLARLAASTMRLGVVKADGHASTTDAKIVSSFDVWLPKADRQRILWPTTIRLDLEYFETSRLTPYPSTRTT
jgi:hypothetical protein